MVCLFVNLDSANRSKLLRQIGIRLFVLSQILIQTFTILPTIPEFRDKASSKNELIIYGISLLLKKRTCGACISEF